MSQTPENIQQRINEITIRLEDLKAARGSGVVGPTNEIAELEAERERLQDLLGRREAFETAGNDPIQADIQAAERPETSLN